ncbi:hypothetical protein BH09MYX1_BH09MYX1_27460 [soil metagenome]
MAPLTVRVSAAVVAVIVIAVVGGCGAQTSLPVAGDGGDGGDAANDAFGIYCDSWAGAIDGVDGGDFVYQCRRGEICGSVRWPPTRYGCCIAAKGTCDCRSANPTDRASLCK